MKKNSTASATRQACFFRFTGLSVRYSIIKWRFLRRSFKKSALSKFI